MSTYVPIHKESRAFAKNITKGMKSDLEKYKTITNWVSENIVYDYIRAIQIPKVGGKPDIDRCWTKHLGICLDGASMATGMLRAVGLDAVLCFGHTEKAYHAWVETKIGGKNYRFDWVGKAKQYKVEKRFT